MTDKTPIDFLNKLVTPEKCLTKQICMPSNTLKSTQRFHTNLT